MATLRCKGCGGPLTEQKNGVCKWCNINISQRDCDNPQCAILENITHRLLSPSPIVHDVDVLIGKLLEKENEMIAKRDGLTQSIETVDMGKYIIEKNKKFRYTDRIGELNEKLSTLTEPTELVNVLYKMDELVEKRMWIETTEKIVEKNMKKLDEIQKITVTVGIYRKCRETLTTTRTYL
jgi:hypothetical protein